MVEKNDFTLMKAENERLQTDIEKLKQRLREEITRTQAGVRLDLNLEKGQSRSVFQSWFIDVLLTSSYSSGRIRDEASQAELKIKEVDTRIESEIAQLRTQIESGKVSTSLVCVQGIAV